MRSRVWIGALVWACAVSLGAPDAAARPRAQQRPAEAQAPRVGSIELYGVRTIDVGQIRQAINVAVGDAAPTGEVNDQIVARLKRLQNVERAQVSVVCCDESHNATLFVGVGERGSPSYPLNQPPRDAVMLPSGVESAYEQFVEARESAMTRTDGSSDGSQDQALSMDPAVRAMQTRAEQFADAHLPVMRRAARSASDPMRRAAAVWVLAYAKDKRLVIADLEYALHDSNEEVRANALSAVISFGAAGNQGSAKVTVRPDAFIEMLNSIAWSDRNQAVAALVELTARRSRATLQQLKQTALPSLIEMARWKSRPHAAPAFLLLGRIAGLNDAEIHKRWAESAEETVFAMLGNRGGSRQ